jgi:hypothetical protein
VIRGSRYLSIAKRKSSAGFSGTRQEKTLERIGQVRIALRRMVLTVALLGVNPPLVTR